MSATNDNMPTHTQRTTSATQCTTSATQCTTSATQCTTSATQHTTYGVVMHRRHSTFFVRKHLSDVFAHTAQCSDKWCKHWGVMVTNDSGLAGQLKYSYEDNWRRLEVNHESFERKWREIASPCAIALELIRAARPSKNARKHHRRKNNSMNRVDTTHNVMRDTTQDSSKNTANHKQAVKTRKSRKYYADGQRIPRRTWALAVNALFIVGRWVVNETQESCGLNTLQLYGSMRLLCKELAIRLPLQIPSVHDILTHHRMWYLNVHVMNALKIGKCGCRYHRQQSRERRDKINAKILSLHSVLTYTTVMDDGMREHIYYRTRFFAIVSIQRWWRRIMHKRDNRRSASLADYNIGPSYCELQLEKLAAEKHAKHTAASTSKAKLEAQIRRRQRKHKAQNAKRSKRKTQNADWGKLEAN